MREKNLPIYQKEADILKAIDVHQVVIVVGETGCGKTTQIPPMLFDAGWAEQGLVGCTEPRRVAAMAAARRVAEERNWRLGQKVGFEVRFDKQMSESTRIKFMTDGILMQEVNFDPMLSTYQVVMVDEVHERNIYTDFLLSYLKSLLPLRPEMRLILSSATINPRQFAHYFDDSGIVEIPYKLYPVDIEYREPTFQYIEEAVAEVKRIHESRKPGDILVFMPGLGEISRTLELLGQLKLKRIVYLPLYGNINPEEQEMIFQEFPERKVIVATNVAETSITIPGIGWVIDSGRVRIPGFDYAQNLESLSLRFVSQTSANQRTGRAGRTGKGTCIRLYSEAEFNRQQKFNTPEILGADLTNFVLTAKAYGVKDVSRLDLLTRPIPESVIRAEKMLKSWGALDEAGEITEFGELMQQMPLEAKLARFVIHSQEFGCVEEAVTIASFLSLRDIFLREMGSEIEQDIALGELRDEQSDLVTFLNIWREYAKLDDPYDWCIARGIMPRLMQAVRHIRGQVLQRLNFLNVPISQSKDIQEIIRAITNVFEANLCIYHHDYDYRSGNIQGVRIARSSGLRERLPEYFVSYNLVKVGSRVYARYNTEVSDVLLEEIAPDIWEEVRRPSLVVSVAFNIPVKLKGALKVMLHGTSRVVNLDVDMQRIAANQLKMVANNSVIIEEQKFEISVLRLSQKTELSLLEKGISNLASLPKSRVALAALGLEETQIQEVLYRLKPLGFTERNRTKEAMIAPEVPEEILEPMPVGSDEEVDWLTTSLLNKPAKALDLSGATAMRLVASGITSVRVLVSKTENELLGLDRFSYEHLAEVKDRLAFYGLSLKPEPEKAWGFSDLRRIQEIAYANKITEEEAKELHGLEHYLLFKAFREAKSREERTKIRNEIAVRNLGLPGRFATWRWNSPNFRKDDPAIDLDDLFQEGSMGLLRGTETFDYTLGFRYSTYVFQWIKQFANRALADASILPVHMKERISRLLKAISELRMKLAREPKLEELAKKLRQGPEAVQFTLDCLKFYTHFPSLDAKVGGDEADESDSQFLDFLESSELLGSEPKSPTERLYSNGNLEDEMFQKEFSEKMADILKQAPLLGIERRFLELRFGLAGESEHTLEEVAEMYGLTRERVRQIEEMGLDVLRTPEVWEQVQEFVPSLPEPSAGPSQEREALLSSLGDKVVHPELLPPPAKSVLEPAEILNEVASKFGLSVEELLERKRTSELVEARWLAIFRLRDELGLSFSEICHILGLGHSTVMHGYKKFRQKRRKDEP